MNDENELPTDPETVWPTHPSLLTPRQEQLFWGFLVGFVVGSAISLFAGIMINGMSGQSQMVSAWREIQPGMTIAEVNELMGEPNDVVNAGEEWPSFVKRFWNAERYEKDHGVLVYVMGLSQVMLVIYDEQAEVTFVSATTT